MPLDKSPKDLGLEDLETLYTQAEQCDKRVFAEQRTNLQLVAGEHYVREGSRYWNRIRDNKQLTDEQRLKLTKNHIQRIMKIYQSTIMSASPGVACEAKDEKSLQHQKAAELHYAVVQDWKTSCHFEEKQEEWCKNFFEIGEVACKVFWEANEGHIMGYDALQNEDPHDSETDEVAEELEEHKDDSWMQGNLEDEPESDGGVYSTIQEIDEDKPIYSGQIVFETIYGYNLKRDPDVGSMSESPYLIYTKMTSLSSLRVRLGDDAYNKMKSSTSFEYTIFDNNIGSYRNTKNQVLVKECYFRPTPMIPRGYFFIWVSEKLLSKGELPFGFFPIVYEACEKQTGNPRGHSVIRHIRPCQIELNRCASKVAEHQITIGDDKVFLPSTTKLSQGATLPGIRQNMYTGQAPIIVPGRTGDQYLPYMSAQIDEMYKLAELDEVVQDVPPETDIYTLLYRNLRQKKKFTYYTDKFERFLCRVVELGLKITKSCIPDEALIPAIGKNEYINISEFKSTDDLCHRVVIKARTDDIESQMGKQLVINHFLQYAGGDISAQDKGMAMRLSPFLNKEKMFEDLTLDYDNVTNDILALDRGQQRPPRPYDNHKYIVRKLSARVNQADFDFLPPQVKHMYEQKIQMHEQLIAKQAAEQQRAEQGFIPTTGYLVAMDFYVTEPGGDPNKTRRVRVPSDSVEWLLKQLETQGSMMKDIKGLPPQAISDMAGMLPPPGASPGGPPRPPGPAHMGGQATGPMMGQARPLGVPHGNGAGPGVTGPGPWSAGLQQPAFR